MTSYRDYPIQKFKLDQSEDGAVEEREEEVDDVDGGEEDVDDEVAGMQLLVTKDGHDRYLKIS